MKKFFIWLTALTILGIGGIFAGIFIVQKTYYLTFYEAVNKISVKIKLKDEGERLLSYAPKFESEYLAVSVSEQWPRIDVMGEGNTESVRSQLASNLETLKQNRVFTVKCDRIELVTSLYCFAQGEQESYQLTEAIIGFKTQLPQEVGDYGNGAIFAIFLDIARSLIPITKENELIIDRKVAKLLENYLFVLDGESASLFHGRSSLAAGAFLLATQLNLNNDVNKKLFSRAFGHFYDFFTAFERVEIWPEGYNYWINQRALEVVVAVNALKNVQGIENIDLRAQKLLETIGLWHIYNTRPDWVMQGWGDEGPRIDLRDETAKVVNVLANTTNRIEISLYAELLQQRFGGYNYFYGYKHLIPITLPKNSPNPTKLSNENRANVSLESLSPYLPTSAIFGRGTSNHIVIRSGWGNDDTFIQIRGSDRFTHHQHFDAGAFTLFKKRPIVVNASKYNGMFTDNRLYFTGRSVSKNTIFINSDEESFQPSKHYEFDSKDGGQRIPMATHSNIYDFENLLYNLTDNYHLDSTELIDIEVAHNSHTLTTLDITKAYNSIYYSAPSSKAKVRRAERTFLYVNSLDTLFILDRIVKTDAKYAVGSRFYVANKPQVGNEVLLKGNELDGVIAFKSNEITVTTPEQNYKVTTLGAELGNENALNKYVIGGLRYRSFVGSIENSNVQGRNIPIELSDNVDWFDKSDWRIELVDNSLSNEVYLLTIFEPEKLDADTASQWKRLDDGVNKMFIGNNDECVFLQTIDKALKLSYQSSSQCFIGNN